VNALTARQLEELAAFGFDPALFQHWQQAVASGAMSKARNVVAGPLLPPPAGAIAALPAAGTPAHAALLRRGATAIQRGELGVVVLNGGMATRFGGVVKGVVPVLGDDRSFLGLVCEDIRSAQRAVGGRIQLYLMNSFATDAATRAHFDRHRYFGLDPAQVHHFTQFVSVRMQTDGSLFLDKDGKPSWYGPGHGDFAPAFRRHCLRQFFADGGRHLLVRNVDNLGARISVAILGHHLAAGKDMTVELVEKRAGDVGGSPYLHAGRVQLVEQIRYPAGFDASIVDVFNCNTFTFTASALDRDFALGRYFVEKNADGKKAVQIEHLIGEMTAVLPTNFLRVPRSGADNRFLPVKEPADLQQVQAEITGIYGARGQSTQL
jgi:UTP--glucose-1-phosphate uridylyltransferase